MNDSIETHDVTVTSTDSGGVSADKREVVVEAAITIDIKNVGEYTIMATPRDELALALGFCLAEGIIDGADDVAMCVHCPDDPHIIRVQLVEGKEGRAAKRNLLIVGSCGICGAEEIDKTIASLPAAPDTLRLTTKQVIGLPEKLRASQQVFGRTGGSHAAALVRDGEIIAACEDIGRHNAFDKAIGACLLQQVSTQGTVAVLSGRISVELVIKAARAGVELLAAVSAPTTLAIETAQRCGITLCGFVRPPEATVYCHPQRIRS